MKTLEEEIKITREDLTTQIKVNAETLERCKSYEIKASNAEYTIKHLESELSACRETIKNFQLEIQDKTLMVLSLQESMNKHVVENVALAKKLAELKNAILNENISNKFIFTGKKKEKLLSWTFSLSFTKTNDGFFVVVFKDEKGKSQEIIYLDNIEELKPSSDLVEDNCLSLVFYKNKKLTSWNLLMNENIHEVIRVYRDFRDRYYKMKENLYY